jgi:hypothetical protein
MTDCDVGGSLYTGGIYQMFVLKLRIFVSNMNYSYNKKLKLATTVRRKNTKDETSEKSEQFCSNSVFFFVIEIKVIL